MGKFAPWAPIENANIVEWVEQRSGGVMFGADGTAVSQPERSIRCRAWARDVSSLDEFMAMMVEAQGVVGSFEVSVRQRGRSGVHDLVAILMDYDPAEDGDVFVEPLVVESI